MKKYKIISLVFLSITSGAVVGLLLSPVLGRKPAQPSEKHKFRACLQYVADTKWIGDCDVGDDDVACPDWAIEVFAEQAIAPCSAEL